MTSQKIKKTLQEEEEENTKYRDLWVAVIVQAIKDYCFYEKNINRPNFKKRRQYSSFKTNYLDAASFLESDFFSKICATIDLNENYIRDNIKSIYYKILFLKFKVNRKKKRENYEKI